MFGEIVLSYEPVGAALVCLGCGGDCRAFLGPRQLLLGDLQLGAACVLSAC